MTFLCYFCIVALPKQQQHSGPKGKQKNAPRAEEIDEDAEVVASEFHANDQKSYEGVQKMIECKFWILKRKHGDNCNVRLLVPFFVVYG